MRKEIKRLCIKTAAIFATGLTLCMFFSGPSDQYLRNRVVKLTSSRGACSGEQVRAPSGVDYVLTAAHCLVLAEEGQIAVHTEDGKTLQRKIIAEDPNSDLLLLEGVPNLKGLDIAPYTLRFDHYRAFTHGKSLDTYKTEGAFIQRSQVTIPLFIENMFETRRCDMPKYKEIQDIEGVICVIDVIESTTSVSIVPGSSGGPAVDDSGRLVGVASATDGMFGYFVTLPDIKQFLHNY